MYYDKAHLPPIGDTKYGRYIQQIRESDFIESTRRWLIRTMNNESPNSADPCPVTESEIRNTFEESPHPNKNDWTNWKDNQNKKIVYPLRHLNLSFAEWERHLGITSSNYTILTNLPSGRVAQANASNIYRSRIMISAYCTCLGVIRAGFMHEVYEMRVAAKYGYYNLNFWWISPCNTLAENLQGTIVFEQRWEGIRREQNVKDCKTELSRIQEHIVTEKGSQSEADKDKLYRDADELHRFITHHAYIPGYCEIYTPHAYRLVTYSSIARVFKEADARKIKYKVEG